MTTVEMNWRCEVIINVHVSVCLSRHDQCMRVLRKSSLFPTALCRTSRVAAVEASLKHRAPAGLCVCVCGLSPLFCTNPLLPNRSTLLSKPFLFAAPSTRGHTLKRVTAARLGLTQKGHVNLPLQAVQTWMSCRFHRNDGLLFLGLAFFLCAVVVL